MALPRLRLWQLLVSVHFFGRTGGIVPTVREIVEQVEQLAKEGK